MILFFFVSACFNNDDCPANSVCLDLVDVTTRFLTSVNALYQYDVIATKANIQGRECWRDPSESINRVSADELLDAVVASKNRLRDIYSWFERHNIVLQRPKTLMDDSSAEINTDVAPSVRQGNSYHLEIADMNRDSITIGGC
ncbi:MAG: hypothetical protein AAFO91_20210 [Bacteroidota bacterium]